MTDFDMPGPGHSWEERGGWMVKRLAADLGISLIQAAGIVGNLGFESAGLTKLHEVGQPAGRGGYGWGQWTADRRVTFLAYCAGRGLDWHSDEANYGYLLTELRGAYKHTVAHLHGVMTLEAAVFSVGQTYERPGGTTATLLPGYDGRLSYGKRALAAAAGTAGKPLDPIVEMQMQVQRSLADAGFYHGEIDGAPGTATFAAMNRYRLARGV